MKLAWLFIPMILGFAPFDSPEGLVEEGNALFSQERYDEAKEKYDRALELAEEGAPVKYNRANTLFKKGDLEGALKDYREGAAFGDDALKAKSFYNMGNALYAGQKFNEAASSFKEALKYDPEDLDAKMNLELALKKMEEQKQKQENGGGNKEDGEDQKPQQDGHDKKEDEKKAGGGDEMSSGEEDGDIKSEDERGPQMKNGEKKKMSREEAERLLENLDDRNIDLQNMADMLKGSGPATVEKDW